MNGKKYEIYNVNNEEVYTWGYNEFIAMCNLFTLQEQHGKDIVKIRWIDR